MYRASLRLLTLVTTALLCTASCQKPTTAHIPLATTERLQRARIDGDLTFQRHYMWQRLATLAEPDPQSGHPLLLSWAGKAQAFDPGSRKTDVPVPRNFAAWAAQEMRWRQQHVAATGADVGDVPTITFVHFNAPALAHLQHHRLGHAGSLDKLLHKNGRLDPRPAIPALPRAAAIAMSAWWPVAREGNTPMPVWDEGAPMRKHGSNSYLNWPRVLAIMPARNSASPDEDRISFAGRQIDHPDKIEIERFVHVRITPELAAILQRDASATKLASMALGRHFEAGDWLALVGLHLMTAELQSGLWATWWWHDRARDGSRKAPATLLDSVWHNYRMDAVFDAEIPNEPDGSPRICFNPWFDAPLSDAAPSPDAGTGVTSNCLSCHARAGWPLVNPALVTRGTPDTSRDRAFQPGQLATGMLWSLPQFASSHAH